MDASRLMTLDVTCVDEDTPIGTAWELMQRQHVRHLPVVEQNRLVGMVSDRDLLLRAEKRLDGSITFPELCAAEVMTFKPVSCAPDTPLDEIAAIMAGQHIDALPVCSPLGQLVGLVTTTDLLRLLADRVELGPRPYVEPHGWQNLA